MENRRQNYLSLMQIPAWRLRADAFPSAAPAQVALANDISASLVIDAPLESAPSHLDASPEATPAAALSDVAAANDLAALGWPELRLRVAQCTDCSLHSRRRNTVFGSGSTSARLVLVGEPPGQREDESGEPFVGPAGELLGAMMAAIGLRREDVFIANILKCRPPRNRDPEPEEVTSCTPMLTRQLELLQPDLLVALGRVAAQHLLETKLPLGKLRGQVHRYGQRQLPLMATYHPADLLRSPLEKRRSWEDLCAIRQMLSEARE